MNTSNSRQKGQLGELIACKFLHSRGYKILDKNFRIRKGELDIIARCPKGELVFIEVKSSLSNSAGTPESWVGSKKKKQIYKIANAWLSFNKLKPCNCRFDVVSVNMSSFPYQISHFKNAFLAIL